MSRTPTLTVVESPPYQPIANAAFAILQKAHDALAFLEIEASDKYHKGLEVLDQELKEWNDIPEEAFDRWLQNHNAKVLQNASMESLHDELKSTVQKLESALGALESYR